jgi:hypothetical protein
MRSSPGYSGLTAGPGANIRRRRWINGVIYLTAPDNVALDPARAGAVAPQPAVTGGITSATVRRSVG